MIGVPEGVGISRDCGQGAGAALQASMPGLPGRGSGLKTALARFPKPWPMAHHKSTSHHLRERLLQPQKRAGRTDQAAWAAGHSTESSIIRESCPVAQTF